MLGKGASARGVESDRASGSKTGGRGEGGGGGLHAIITSNFRLA